MVDPTQEQVKLPTTYSLPSEYLSTSIKDSDEPAITDVPTIDPGKENGLSTVPGHLRELQDYKETFTHVPTNNPTETSEVAVTSTEPIAPVNPVIDKLRNKIQGMGLSIKFQTEDGALHDNPLQTLFEQDAVRLVDAIEEQTKENEKMKAALDIAELSHAYFLQTWDKIGAAEEDELEEIVGEFTDKFSALEWFMELFRGFNDITSIFNGARLQDLDIDENDPTYENFLRSLTEIQSDLESFFRSQNELTDEEISTSDSELILKPGAPTPVDMMEKLANLTNEFILSEKPSPKINSKLGERLLEMQHHAQKRNRTVLEDFRKFRLEVDPG